MITVVTGTDTGVGKTVVSAALAVHYGPEAVIAKPAQTGVRTAEPDISVAQRLADCAVTEFTRLDDPLAPATAARRQGQEIPTVSDHVDRVCELAKAYRSVIVEGSGGLLVPLDTAGRTLADLATELSLTHPVQVRIVTRLGLGTLNHTALTVAALRAHRLEPTGLVLGSVPAQPDLAEQCNRTELPRITGVPIVGEFPEGAGDLTPQAFQQRWVAGLS